MYTQNYGKWYKGSGLKPKYSVRTTSYAIKYDGILDSIIYGLQLSDTITKSSWQSNRYWQDSGRERYLRDSIELSIARILEYPVIWIDWK